VCNHHSNYFIVGALRLAFCTLLCGREASISGFIVELQRQKPTELMSHHDTGILFFLL